MSVALLDHKPCRIDGWSQTHATRKAGQKCTNCVPRNCCNQLSSTATSDIQGEGWSNNTTPPPLHHLPSDDLHVRGLFGLQPSQYQQRPASQTQLNLMHCQMMRRNPRPTRPRGNQPATSLVPPPARMKLMLSLPPKETHNNLRETGGMRRTERSGEEDEEGCPLILERGDSDSEDGDGNLGDRDAPIEEGEVSTEDIMAENAFRPFFCRGVLLAMFLIYPGWTNLIPNRIWTPIWTTIQTRMRRWRLMRRWPRIC